LKTHCVFIPDKREEGERFIYVIDLTNKNSIFKIRDYTGDDSFVHANFVKNKIFMASANKFKMVDLSKQEGLKEGEVRLIDVEKLGLKIWETSITVPLKMHCFF
jgi:hypothetical protein